MVHSLVASQIERDMAKEDALPFADLSLPLSIDADFYTDVRIRISSILFLTEEQQLSRNLPEFQCMIATAEVISSVDGETTRFPTLRHSSYWFCFSREP